MSMKLINCENYENNEKRADSLVYKVNGSVHCSHHLMALFHLNGFSCRFLFHLNGFSCRFLDFTLCNPILESSTMPFCTVTLPHFVKF